MQPHPLDKIFAPSVSPSTTSPKISAHPLDKIFAPTKSVASGSAPTTPKVPFPDVEKSKGKGFLAGISDPLSKAGGAILKALLPSGLEGQQLQQGKVTGLFGGDVDITGYKDGQELQGTEFAKDVAGSALSVGSYLPFGGAVSTVGKAVVKKTMPALAKTAVEGGLGTGMAFGGQALQEQKSLQESGVEALKGGAIGTVAGPIIGKVVGAVGVGLNKMFTAKTAQEILSTPIENLPKLSTTERNFYFAEKAKTLTQQYQDDLAKFTAKHEQEVQALNKSFQETTEKIGAEQVATINSVKAQAETLNKQLADASIAEVEQLKPKLIQTMRKSSDTYRQLVDDEIGQVADVKVTNDEIAASVRNRFSDDPARAEEIISILKTKTDGPHTVKSVYENTKALRKEIGSGAKQGSRTLTAQEYNTTEAISALLDFLKNEKGVDLSKANKFWAEYAPVKNKLYRYIQPYNPSGTETASFKTFAKILASNDPYNQNFIRETEKLLGISFKDSKAREILSKIDANKKAQIAAKIESATKLTAAKVQKLQDSIALKEKMATTKLSLKETKALEEQKQELIKLTATLKAERRTILKRIIGGFLVLGLGSTATNTILGGF